MKKSVGYRRQDQEWRGRPFSQFVSLLVIGCLVNNSAGAISLPAHVTNASGFSQSITARVAEQAVVPAFFTSKLIPRVRTQAIRLVSGRTLTPGIPVAILSDPSISLPLKKFLIGSAAIIALAHGVSLLVHWIKGKLKPNVQRTVPRGAYTLRYVLGYAAGIWVAAHTGQHFVLTDLTEHNRFPSTPLPFLISWAVVLLSYSWHSVGHVLFGKLAGANSRLKWNTVLLDDDVDNPTPGQRIAHLIGGPASNVLLGMAAWTALALFFATVSASGAGHTFLAEVMFWNIAMGIGALIPLDSRSGGGLIINLLRDYQSRKQPGHSAFSLTPSKVLGAMHVETTGDAMVANQRLDALRRWLRMKNIDIEEWANEQASGSSDYDRKKLREALILMGLSDEQIKIVTPHIILADVPDRVRLDGTRSRIGGLIIQTKFGPKILFPRDRINYVAQDREHLADLLHEVVEISLLHQGVDVDRAHDKAMEARQSFLKGDPEFSKLFEALFSGSTRRQLEFDGYGGIWADEAASHMQIEDAYLMDLAPQGGKIYGVRSTEGIYYAFIVDESEQIIGVALHENGAGPYGVTLLKFDPNRYLVLAPQLNPIFQKKWDDYLAKAKSISKTIHDRTLEYGSVRRTDAFKAKFFFPLLNRFYGLTELRSDFINNALVRHVVSTVKQKTLLAFQGSLYLIGGTVGKYGGAISFGGHTVYDMHSHRTMDSFPLHHLGRVVHELTHEAFNEMPEDARATLMEHFLAKRQDMANTLRNSVAYRNNDDYSIVSEMVAQIIGNLADAYTTVTIQDDLGQRHVSYITGEDIDVLIKSRLLPESFVPNEQERRAFHANGGAIGLYYLSRVYPQARLNLENNISVGRRDDKILGAMHEAVVPRVPKQMLIDQLQAQLIKRFPKLKTLTHVDWSSIWEWFDKTEENAVRAWREIQTNPKHKETNRSWAIYLLHGRAYTLLANRVVIFEFESMPESAGTQIPTPGAIFERQGPEVVAWRRILWSAHPPSRLLVRGSVADLRDVRRVVKQIGLNIPVELYHDGTEKPSAYYHTKRFDHAVESLLHGGLYSWQDSTLLHYQKQIMARLFNETMYRVLSTKRIQMLHQIMAALFESAQKVHSQPIDELETRTEAHSGNRLVKIKTGESATVNPGEKGIDLTRDHESGPTGAIHREPQSQPGTAEVETPKFTIRLIPQDEETIKEQREKTTQKLRERLDRPVQRGTGWIRVVATPQEALEFHKAWPHTDEGTVTKVVNSQTYTIPVNVWRKMTSWVERSKDFERKGYFLSRETSSGVEIVDFIPLGSYAYDPASGSASNDLEATQQADTMFEMYGFGKDNEQEFGVDLSVQEELAFPKVTRGQPDLQSIPVHSHHVTSKYPEGPSKNDQSIARKIEVVYCLATERGVFYDKDAKVALRNSETLTIAPLAMARDWVAGQLIRNGFPGVARVLRIVIGWVAAAVEVIPSLIPAAFPGMHRDEDRAFARFWQPALIMATLAGGLIGLLVATSIHAADQAHIPVAAAALANFLLHGIINTHGELAKEQQLATAA